MSKPALDEIAASYSKRKHESVNHFYGKEEYAVHLRMVVRIARDYIHLIPNEDHETVLAACWAHDLIEDTRQTYNDVKKVLGEKVADIVYALTNEKGKNRKERANDKYYEGIRNTRYATFVKVCDRIANIKYSQIDGGKMYDLYRREFVDFATQLESSDLQDMFNEMEYLLYPHKRPLSSLKQ